jgi:hypothetical protein
MRTLQCALLRLAEQVAFFSEKVRTYDQVAATPAEEVTLNEKPKVDKDNFLV